MTTVSSDRCPMLLDLAGRVRNMQVPVSRPLLPLFEAVVNSIQAMPAGSGVRGRVNISVERVKELLAEESPSAPINAFKIVDNGVGFTERNFKSFCTSDSREKASQGGKGIGRMLWIKAFERVDVESAYQENEEARQRRFSFSLSEGCVVDHQVTTCAPGTAPKTVVYLQGFKQPFIAKCPRKLAVVAAKVLEHCVPFLLSDDAPQVAMIDVDGTRIVLNDLLEKQYRARIIREKLSIGKEEFAVVHLRTPTTQSKVHRLHYFANNREVLNEPLSKFIPPLQRPLRDGAEEFVWSTFVFGEYLDAGVDAERCDFLFPREKELEPDLEGVDSTLTLADIRAKVVETTRPHLDALLAPVREKSRQRVEHYIEHVGFEYRVVLNYAPEVIDSIPEGASDIEVDVALHRARFEIDRKSREDFRKLNEGSSTAEDLRKREDVILSKIGEIAKGELAKYLVHRKVVLEALARRLELRGDDAYSFESEVHELICPMKMTTEQIPDDFQNLWVIDERLPFHRYLASDRPLATSKANAANAAIHKGLAKEPDLFAAFTSLAFTEARDSDTASSLVIVEFKRPQRDDYSREKNPVSQVAEYVYEISHGRATDARGRPVRVGPHTRYEAYIICDVTEPLKKYLIMEGLQPSPDGASYRGYNSALHLAIEVIPYGDLLSNARKRNRAFFVKLGIPDP